VVVHPGEAVVLYTDGVTEADRGHVLQPAELAGRLAAVGPDPEALTAHLHALAGGAPGAATDDAATLVVRLG
jgi:serine phosphatase RsbU (regulator of sigma subunit)